MAVLASTPYVRVPSGETESVHDDQHSTLSAQIRK